MCRDLTVQALGAWRCLKETVSVTTCGPLDMVAHAASRKVATDGSTSRSRGTLFGAAKLGVGVGARAAGALACAPRARPARARCRLGDDC